MLIAQDRFHEPREVSSSPFLGAARSPGRRELRERRPRDFPEIVPHVEPIVVARRPPEPRRWLEQIYTFCAEGKLNSGLYLVLDELDELLHEHNVARCDEILVAADVDRMPAEVLLAFLMGTFRARAALSARVAFLDRVETKLRATTPDRVDSLLASLR
jgi:hypothetical protein